METKAKTMTSKPEKAKDKDGSEIIDLTEKKTVFMTDKAPHHAAGEENRVHPKIADLFVKRGYAKYKKGDEGDEI